MVANYMKKIITIIKPFTNRIKINPSNELVTNETYFKVKGDGLLLINRVLIFWQHNKFAINSPEHIKVIQIIALTNDDEVSTKFRSSKQ